MTWRVKMIKQIINKIKGEEKPNTTQVLIGQLTYIEDWKKEDFLSEYPNLDNEGKFIVQVYHTCRILAEQNGLLEKVWNNRQDFQYTARIEWINKVQSVAISMLEEVAEGV